jgi:hypothetical protein
MNTTERARAIRDYMIFRAGRENQVHSLPLSFYKAHIKNGCTNFFGVTIGADGLDCDDEQPTLFKDWIAIQWLERVMEGRKCGPREAFNHIREYMIKSGRWDATVPKASAS